MVYELPAEIDIARFKSAWSVVLENWPILRTRFFYWHAERGNSQLMQAVVNQGPIRWVKGRTLLDYLKLDKRDRMQVGDGMLRLAAFRDNRENKHYFVMTAHHAIYDGWTLGLLLASLRCAYMGQPPPKTTPFNSFVAHLAAADPKGGQSFWRQYVANAPRLSWPELPSPDFRPQSTAVKSRLATLPHGNWRENFTSATLMRAAFAILLGAYSNAEDVVFASTVYGRAAGFGFGESVAGPTLATIPVRVPVNPELTVHELMARVQRDATKMLAFEQVGMQNIKRLNRDGLATIDAQSLLVVQVTAEGDAVPTGGRYAEVDRGLQLHPVRVSKLENGFLSSALVLEATASSKQVELVVTYDERVLDSAQVQRFLRQLDYIVGELCNSTNTARLKDLKFAPVEDLKEMEAWNPRVPAQARTLLHELVSAQARQQPEAEALVSHEGTLTYRQLDEISDRLARYLWEVCGLRPGTCVPLIFEKSIWAVVTMMGVLKVGAANVALNPAHSADNLRSLVEDVDAKFVLCSPANRSLAGEVASQSFCVDPVEFGPGRSVYSDANRESLHPRITPEHLAFLLFTSGSTGRPKAVMIDHTAFCSSIAGHAKTLCYNRGSRNLQFTAYTSDVSIGEIFTSLSRGATVCVPSDAERMGDLADAMERMSVDWAFLTPSVAALLDPTRVPTLRTLLFGGETATATNISTWSPRLHLINSFGPAETSIWCHAHPQFPKDGDGSDIGNPMGCLTWIADPYYCNKLMPIGAIGELVIEGPNVAAGYYNNQEKTRVAFPESLPFIPVRGTRIYRTGDMARWMPDGRVQFLGRRDGQVKLHGLKVETGEVEHAIRASFRDQSPEVAVELVRHPGPPEDARLIAFVSFTAPNSPQDPQNAVVVTDKIELQNFAESTRGLRDRLSARLAPYMIPSFFVPLTCMPLTASAKTDRRALRALVVARGFVQLADFSVVTRREVQPPQTATEKRLHAMWCSVLTLSPDDFGIEADFFECGGDSIGAMRLASMSLAANIRLTVQNIYDSSRLGDLASVVDLHQDSGDSSNAASSLATEIEPFSLSPTQFHGKLGDLLSQVAKICMVALEEVGDVYPCTPLQRLTVERTVTHKGAYWLHNVFEMSEGVLEDRLEDAWQRLAASHAALRTRIIVHNGEHLQVVMRSTAQIRKVTKTTLEQFLASDRPCGPTYGAPLMRASIVRFTDSSARYFVVALHHATYDAWSLTRIFTELGRYYTQLEGGNDPCAQPTFGPGFNTFVKTLCEQDRSQALDFWREYLLDAKTEPFAIAGDNSRANCLLRHSIELPNPYNAHGVTHAVSIFAAVALALHRQLQAPDTMLKLVSTGRTMSSVARVDELIGPTVAIVPLRVNHSTARSSLQEYLAHVNTQVRRVAPFEQTGIDVVTGVSSDAMHVCHGMPQLIVQPFDPYTEQPAEAIGLHRRELSALDNNDDSSFTIDVSLEASGRGRNTTLNALHLRIVFDDAVVTEDNTRQFVADLDSIVREMAVAQLGTPLEALQPEMSQNQTERFQSGLTLERVGEGLF